MKLSHLMLALITALVLWGALFTTVAQAMCP